MNSLIISTSVFNNEPKHKNYILLNDRLNSFIKNKYMFDLINIDIIALAKAGFFYNSKNEDTDKCTCFFCNVSIINWQVANCPLYEHLISSKNCLFLKMLLGEKIINMFFEIYNNFEYTSCLDVIYNLIKNIKSEYCVNNADYVKDLFIEDPYIKIRKILLKYKFSLPLIELLFKNITDQNNEINIKNIITELINNLDKYKQYMNDDVNLLINEILQNPLDVDNFYDEYEQLLNKQICCICMNDIKRFVNLPCGHIYACVNCGLNLLDKCVICNNKVNSYTVIIFPNFF